MRPGVPQRLHKFNAKREAVYLAELAEHGRLNLAAEKAGMSTVAMWDRRKADPALEERVQAALQKFTERFLTHYDNIVFNGHEKKVYGPDGELISRTVEPATALISQRAKSLLPEFRDAAKVEVSGGLGVDLGKLTDEELAERIDQLLVKTGRKA